MITVIVERRGTVARRRRACDGRVVGSRREGVCIYRRDVGDLIYIEPIFSHVLAIIVQVLRNAQSLV
jgi:hypothetical protein